MTDRLTRGTEKLFRFPNGSTLCFGYCACEADLGQYQGAEYDVVFLDEAGQLQHGWKVVEICYDGHNATDLAIQLCEAANNEDLCVEISQTCAGQNMAVKGFRELLLQGKIVLEESGLAIWCMGNGVEIMNNYGDIKLSKKHKDDTQRIDPLAAAMDALARALIRRNNPTLSDRLEDSTWTM